MVMDDDDNDCDEDNRGRWLYIGLCRKTKELCQLKFSFVLVILFSWLAAFFILDMLNYEPDTSETDFYVSSTHCLIVLQFLYSVPISVLSHIHATYFWADYRCLLAYAWSVSFLWYFILAFMKKCVGCGYCITRNNK